MAHIKLPEGEPGIIGLLVAYRETEKHLNSFGQALMRGPSSLSGMEKSFA